MTNRHNPYGTPRTTLSYPDVSDQNPWEAHHQHHHQGHHIPHNPPSQTPMQNTHPLEGKFIRLEEQLKNLYKLIERLEEQHEKEISHLKQEFDRDILSIKVEVQAIKKAAWNMVWSIIASGGALVFAQIWSLITK